MKRMISLRHIEFREFRRHIEFPGFRARSPLLPKGIGELTCLMTLPTFVVGEESGPGIEELKGLNQLWGDFCITGLNHVRNGECAREANLKAKKHLHSLELSWLSDHGTAADTEGNSEEAVIENLEPHSRLKKLAVENYMGMKFPNRMKMLTNLTDIRLSGCKRCEHLPPLWRLPFLESLELRNMRAVKYIVELDGSDNSKDIFPCLKLLELEGMFDLEGWSSQQEDGDGDEQGRERDEQVILQSLCTLSINNSPKLTRIPWLRHVSSLTSLKIGYVGLDMIEIPASQSLKELSLSNMPNLERWSVQEADEMIFSSLRVLDISDCPKLICLPQLLLPALGQLDMSGVSCDKIEFSTSHSLRLVHLYSMPNLERLSLKASNDNEHLVCGPFIEFSVNECPRMTRLPHLLPSISISLIISASNEMLLEWVVANYTSLSNLSIKELLEDKHLPSCTGLHTLKIIDSPNLTSLSNQLENLPALEELIIIGCNDLELSLPPDGLQQQQRSPPPLDSLRVLKIINSCHNQISLPGDGIVLTSLKSLNIVSCANLESISADMLQNLTSLEIKSCPKLWSSLVSLENLKSIVSLKISGCPDLTRLLGSMENFKSLTELRIEDCPGMRSLPESVKNLTSLTDLRIKNCPGMLSLPESMGDLTLLRRLEIGNCPGITTLPNGLKRLGNLYDLRIYQCPDLKSKLRFPKGRDWHKVAHVPCRLTV
ncbi:hypothetical protein MRB53_032419 [Persea americana]|uniref:Uncharacterized protein n=1 Tax=Persea americana TaxID=3435 RepID=A0ACC2KRR6_PERAE|nr:hypothetical protein MRB53_032419 [Persea americana]